MHVMRYPLCSVVVIIVSLYTIDTTQYPIRGNIMNMGFMEWLRQLTIAERAIVGAQSGFTTSTLNYIASTGKPVSPEGLMVIRECEFNKTPSSRGGQYSLDHCKGEIAEYRKDALQRQRAKIKK